MAKTKSITIRSGRTIPHPTRSFANIKTEFEMEVQLDETDDLETVVRNTRMTAEQVVQTHQEQVANSIRTGESLDATTDRIKKLETQSATIAAELEHLKKHQSEQSQGLLFGTTEITEHARHHDEDYDDYDDE